MSRKTKKQIHDNTYKMKLKEEQLDISKEWIEYGDVEVHKETIREEKTITIPIFREELVIEKKMFDTTSPEIIRIPISEEQVDVSKHKVFLNDVSVYKNQFEENEIIEEILRRENLHIDTHGDVEVIEKRIF